MLITGNTSPNTTVGYPKGNGLTSLHSNVGTGKSPFWGERFFFHLRGRLFLFSFSFFYFFFFFSFLLLIKLISTLYKHTYEITLIVYSIYYIYGGVFLFASFSFFLKKLKHG